MRIPRFIVISVAAACLSACSGVPPSNDGLGSSPQTAAIKTNAMQIPPLKMDMPRSASSHSGSELLYVADSNGYVYMFTYPKGDAVGHFGANASGGLCVDAVGDVFVTDFNDETVLEYAHGGTKPIATLHPDAQPRACSVDPLTGNLATVNLDSDNTTSVSIFAQASGAPTKYTDANAALGPTCTYDNAGNLYVSAATSSNPFLIAELSHGGNTFTNVTVNGGFRGGNYLQWDGSYIAVTNAAQGKPVAAFQVAVVGSSGQVVGSTTLRGSQGYLKYFWIQGNTIITPRNGGGPKGRKISFWQYPSGGVAIKTIKLPASKKAGAGIALGITVSTSGSGNAVNPLP